MSYTQKCAKNGKNPILRETLKLRNQMKFPIQIFLRQFKTCNQIVLKTQISVLRTD